MFDSSVLLWLSVLPETAEAAAVVQNSTVEQKKYKIYVIFTAPFFFITHTHTMQDNKRMLQCLTAFLYFTCMRMESNDSSSSLKGGKLLVVMVEGTWQHITKDIFLLKQLLLTDRSMNSIVSTPFKLLLCTTTAQAAEQLKKLNLSQVAAALPHDADVSIAPDELLCVVLPMTELTESNSVGLSKQVRLDVSETTQEALHTAAVKSVMSHCDACGTVTFKPMSFCGQCSNVSYCDTRCQKRHWASGHKHKCQQQR